MNVFEKIRLKLISKLGFKYYKEDKYLIKTCLRSVKNKHPKVLDVGCGTGYHSFMFEKYGANVIAFDYDENVIKKANENKVKINSNVNFLIADGRYPEKYFTDKYNIIFMAGFSIFGIDLDKAVMKKYLSMLDEGGRLVFIHNSNLTGVVRKTNWRNHKIEDLRSFFESVGGNVEKIYFYDRHVTIKILRRFAITDLSTKMHILISKITKLPCALVFIVTKNENGN